MDAKKRNLSAKIEDLLGFFPVVIILGVRQCGKTTLARMLRPEWHYFDLERSRDFNFITEDFEFFLKEHPHSVIIDEAQKYPGLFQELRGVIDRNRGLRNRFLLTGSSSMELIKNVSESLAGRVGMVELGTFKANELFGTDLPRFYDIFSVPLSGTTIDFILDLAPLTTHDQLMSIFLQGGYPEPAIAREARFFDVWMENYFQTYVQRDIRALFPRLDLVKYQRFISMLSALSGTIVNRSQVGRSLDISEKSIRDYLEIAQGSYIWRNIPSYEPGTGTAIVKMPKGNFRDSGLANFIQGVLSREQLITHPHVGAAFEAFVSEEIIKAIQATPVSNWNYHYYRTRNGAEIDLVLSGPFGILPIEIKFGSLVKQGHIRSLKAFVHQHDLPLGIVINNSDRVKLIADRILQLPATYI
jgi:uncharacterized protein